jgi:hypothetical protein
LINRVPLKKAQAWDGEGGSDELQLWKLRSSTLSKTDLNCCVLKYSIQTLLNVSAFLLRSKSAIKITLFECHSLFVDRFRSATCEPVDFSMQGTGGCTIKKTNTALLIGIYAEPVQPGECNVIVENLGDYLIGQGI